MSVLPRTQPYEIELVGQAVFHEGKMVPEEVSRRIQRGEKQLLRPEVRGSSLPVRTGVL